jgi:hypothetical protein
VLLVYNITDAISFKSLERSSDELIAVVRARVAVYIVANTH